jgi:hypothetical protein
MTASAGSRRGSNGAARRRGSYAGTTAIPGVERWIGGYARRRAGARRGVRTPWPVAAFTCRLRGSRRRGDDLDSGSTSTVGAGSTTESLAGRRWQLPGALAARASSIASSSAMSSRVLST